jgi:hypothetical protein
MEVFWSRRAHDFDEDAEDLQQGVLNIQRGEGKGRGCLHQKRSIGSLVYHVNFSGESFACEAAVEEVFKC